MIDAGVLLEQAVAALSFDDVAALGPYLEALGISDVYVSPSERRDGLMVLACPTMLGHLPMALLTRERSAS